MRPLAGERASYLIGKVNAIHMMIVDVYERRNRKIFNREVPKSWPYNCSVSRSLLWSLAGSNNMIFDPVHRKSSGNAEDSVIILPHKAKSIFRLE